MHDDLKLSRRQKRILKRKLKRIAGDAVAVIVGAGMFVGLFIAWANEPMPDWSEYIEENHNRHGAGGRLGHMAYAGRI